MKKFLFLYLYIAGCQVCFAFNRREIKVRGFPGTTIFRFSKQEKWVPFGFVNGPASMRGEIKNQLGVSNSEMERLVDLPEFWSGCEYLLLSGAILGSGYNFLVTEPKRLRNNLSVKVIRYGQKVKVRTTSFQWTNHR